MVLETMETEKAGLAGDVRRQRACRLMGRVGIPRRAGGRERGGTGVLPAKTAIADVSSCRERKFQKILT